MSYIKNGILTHNAKIGNATVISNRIESKGYAVPNLDLSPEYITIHNTGDDNVKGENWYNALKNANDTGWRKASWHITVDCNKIYQSVNLKKVAWHAGDGEYGTGNRKSLGIEHVQYTDKEKQKQVWENSIALVKILMDELNINVDKVVQHYKWTKKDCPYLLRHARFGYSWSWYKEQLKNISKTIEGGSYNCNARVNCKVALNVRGNRPNSEGILAPIIDVLDNNTEVLLGYVYKDWGSIFYNGKHGYVNVKYLELIE